MRKEAVCRADAAPHALVTEIVSAGLDMSRMAAPTRLQFATGCGCEVRGFFWVSACVV